VFDYPSLLILAAFANIATQVEQLKKKNNKKATPAAKQTKPEPAETAAPEPVAERAEAAPASEEKAAEEPKKKAQEKPPAKEPAQPLKVETQESSDEDDDDSDEDSSSDEETSASATPSLAQQSKLRSTSFRAGSVTSGGAAPASPFSPDGETAPDIYRKHMARIEELEKENKRLSKEAADSEKRWQKAENELADIREADGEDSEKAGGQEDGLLDSLVGFNACNHNRAQSANSFIEEPSRLASTSEYPAPTTGIARTWSWPPSFHVCGLTSIRSQG
jgi:hypothetical protein